MRLLLCYNKTAYTPGRYLEDGLRRIGAEVDVHPMRIDFRRIDVEAFDAVLFVDSPPKVAAKIAGVERLEKNWVPKLFWVHHGANRLEQHLALCREIRPDLVLMAHSLELAPRFPAPVRFFPFAVAADIFNSQKPLEQRKWDIAFVGNTTEQVYEQRRAVLRAIRAHFAGRAAVTLSAKVYVERLAGLYADAKIVVNCAADLLRTINMRLFEGMGCGALVVTDWVPGLERLFKDGEHCVVFEGVDDLLAKLDHHLAHLDRAQKIASAGYRHVMARHTYEHRARELLDLVRGLRIG